MSALSLPMGQFYILSGPPGSGKSTLLKHLNLPEGFVVSSDHLRRILYGVKLYREEGIDHEHLYGWNKPGSVIFDMMKVMCRERAKEGLTTFVDSTCLTESDRNDFAKIAAAHGMKTHVLIFDVPVAELIRRDEARLAKVGSHVIQRMSGDFAKTSALPYSIVKPGDTFKLTVPTLGGDLYDVVGDVHGLLDEFLELVRGMGYQHNEEGVPVHPDGRKLLFLGDVVDRGRQSLLMLHYVERACTLGEHIFVPGNHEDKLLKTWDHWMRTGEAKGRSRSSTETFLALMGQPKETQERLIGFLRAQPGYRVVESHGQSFAFAHADIVHFDPLTTPKSGLFYGDSDFGKVDSDARYEDNVQRGINKYTLFRGHIRQISNQPHVHSVEFDQAFGGQLAIVRLDGYARDALTHGPEQAFALNVHKTQIAFNYDNFSREHFSVADCVYNYEKAGALKSYTHKETGMKSFDFADIEKLMDAKRVRKVDHPDAQTPVSLYKYGKSVFYDNLWSEHPFLVKARGLVLDMAGHIVQHPFDKIFNYGENGTALDLPDDAIVQAVEKLNGFMGCITKNPYKNELLVTTTGSFDSDFVGYINDFITPDVKERLLNYFNEQEASSQGGKTLMFEVIHPKDNEHPVKYKPEEEGLWLIGARGKGINDPLESEEYLDLIGGELQLRRPKHFSVTFGEVRKWANEHDGEGYIVRHQGEPVVKFKTTSYLAVKFVGRLSDNNIAFMYNHPEKFKLKLDEEYVPMVDALLKNFPTAESYKALPRSERMETVRTLVKDMRLAEEAAVGLQHTTPGL